MALERIAVMTALNLSDELLKLKRIEKHRQENVDSRIRLLVNELDDALDGNWARIELPSVVFASGPDIRLVPNL